MVQGHKGCKEALAEVFGLEEGIRILKEQVRSIVCLASFECAIWRGTSAPIGVRMVTKWGLGGCLIEFKSVVRIPDLGRIEVPQSFLQGSKS